MALGQLAYRTRHKVTYYCLGDDISHMLRRLDEVSAGEVGVARRGPVPPVAGQPADQGQVLARHDGMAGYGVPENPVPGELLKRDNFLPFSRFDRMPRCVILSSFSFI